MLESDGDEFDITLTTTDWASYSGYIGGSALRSASVGSLNVASLRLSIDNLTLASVAAAPAPVPEPSALALFGSGLVGLAGLALSRRRRA